MKFSLNWFKARKKEEELIDLQIKKEKMIVDAWEKETSQKAILYRKLKFVNDVLTVIFNDGSVISKFPATVDDFDDVRSCNTEEDIISVMKGKEPEKKDKIANPTNDDITIVCEFPDFEMAEECVYMNGINRSLPPLLIKRFGEILSKFDRTKHGWEDEAMNDIEYSSLKKFWLKCCLNPNAQSAEDLYTFLTYHNMKIDRHGNFYAYRRVCSVKGPDVSSALVNIISTAYNNVKAVWKKKPQDYRIEEVDGEYSMHKVSSIPKGTIIGNLDTLYLDLPNMTENRYTDAHTRTMDYRVGEIASIPRDKCDNNNNVSCSMGLHAASKKYNYNGFGDTPILMIINPMDAVAVPLGEVGKLRVSRFFFAMTLNEEDGYILDDEDFDVTYLGDVFEEKCLSTIKEHVHKSFAEEVNRHTFNIPQISNFDIANISDSLREMYDVIKNRVVNK